MPLNIPSNYASRVSVHHNGQVNKLLVEMNVSDVGNPELIDAGRSNFTCQVDAYIPWVIRICCMRNKRLSSQAQQIVCPHNPQDTLVIYTPTLAAQQRSNSPIAVVPMSQSQLLQPIPQRCFLFARLGCPPPAIISNAAHRTHAA